MPAVTVYRNRYRDFIESLINVGTDPQTGLLLSPVGVNHRSASRHTAAAEAAAALRLGHFSDALDGFEIRTAIASAKGDDRVRNVPLTSVEPLKAVIGLAYEGTVWGATS